MKRAIQNKLRKALLEDANMSYALYKYELAEHIDYWKAGMRQDRDEFLFVVTEHSGDVAMLLMTDKDELFINEMAREKLQMLWNNEGVYARNIRLLLPHMAAYLEAGDLWVNGVKTEPRPL